MKRRQGFTLVELMVSMALIIFIMAILSQAFIAGMNTFRNLKAAGDLAERLRGVTQILQRDLAADHFDGKRRLSDTNFWRNGPPQQGFFQIWQGPKVGSMWEGVDIDKFASHRTINHFLSFTVKQRGNDMGSFFSATPIGSGVSSPPTTALPLGIGSIQSFGPFENRYQVSINGNPVPYNYQWAAVEWFLAPQMNPATNPLTQDTTATDPTTGAAGIPLYTLYRRQALLVPDNTLVSQATMLAPPLGGLAPPPGGVSSALIGNYLEMSCWANPPLPALGLVYFNNPIDITVPERRKWGGDIPYVPISLSNPLSPLAGSDIQLSDVVSFDVRVLAPGAINDHALDPINPDIDPFVPLWNSPFKTLNTLGGMNNGNPAYPLADPPGGPIVFDTWSSVNDVLSNYSQWNLPSTANSIPLWSNGSGPSIQAIQISIRIWDFKTNQTRQVTIVQAM